MEAGAGGPGRELRWLLGLFARLEAGGAALDRVFESLDLHAQWRLSNPVASRTFQRFPPRRIAYQRAEIDRAVPPPAQVDEPLPSVRRLPVAAARRLIEVGRAALCVRRSETEPMTYADPREVRLVQLEDGLDVVRGAVQPGVDHGSGQGVRGDAEVGVDVAHGREEGGMTLYRWSIHYMKTSPNDL